MQVLGHGLEGSHNLALTLSLSSSHSPLWGSCLLSDTGTHEAHSVPTHSCLRAFALAGPWAWTSPLPVPPVQSGLSSINTSAPQPSRPTRLN